ncbi:MAG: hypothetical protein JW894_11175 [Bacteroidales bacterium]|nr:hypothetical protein [Bacteroidales bacterium]
MLFGKQIEAFNISHELAHLYSCIPFYGNFKENSLLIHFDGGASRSNFSVWHYKKNTVTLLDYHYKLKWLTNLFNTNALVFKLTSTQPKYHYGVPGKYMGLASFVNYNTDLEDWLIRNNFFTDIW